MSRQELTTAIADAAGRVLANQVSGNPMPHMSGDDRNRLSAHKRERFDTACQEAATAALAAIEAAGCVIVPREPTQAMINAGLRIDKEGMVLGVYRAMIAGGEG